MQTLASLFERVQSLKSFNIKRFFSPEIQLQDGIDFVKSFEYMKNLIDLDLFIFFCLPDDAPTLFTKDLFKYIGFLTNLKSLKLYLFVRKLSSQDFFLPLQSLINLQNLSLDLRCCEHRELPGLQSLSQALQSLHNLDKFELLSHYNKVSHSDFISLSNMFKNLTSLQILTLFFFDADIESDSLQLLSTGISHLKLLSFVFNIRNSSSLQQNNAFLGNDQNGLTSFFSTISGFASLMILSLNLSVFALPAKEFQNLSLALREMKQLYGLSLQPPEFDFQSLRSLMSSIKEMSKLALLSLHFQGKELCDEELELVASGLTGCCRSLKKLVLDFYETKKLKNRSLLVLQNALRTLSSLKNLTLAFGTKNTFDGAAVNELFEALSHLKNLEIIKMELPPEVVPLDFEDILKQFSGHWNLNTFTVNEESWLKSVDQNQNQH